MEERDLNNEHAVTPLAVKELKNKRKIAMLTAYDYPTGLMLDRAGVDIVLVGDSLANAALGLPSTKDIGLEEMLHHAKAVCRAVKKALVIVDMPYTTCQYAKNGALITAPEVVKNALCLKNGSGCAAVKIEWFERCLEVTSAVIKSGIPVCGHIGLTPQTAEETGGFKAKGVSAQEALRLLDQAIALEKNGCFAMVMECVPEAVAGEIARKLSIPVIGIGSGRFCDGQVLVTNDILGLTPEFNPRFVKRYAGLYAETVAAAADYVREVREGIFPEQKHTFRIKDEEFASFREKMEKIYHKYR
ncbi:MAG: 3-methyl-2-oxobutanoate hydroxymethyltransferase [Candidatus Omnitrophota bacterium]